MDIFDAVIDWLEKEKAKGRDGLYLSPESKATFDHFLKLSNDPAALAEYVASVQSEAQEVISQEVIETTETVEIQEEIVTEVPVVETPVRSVRSDRLVESDRSYEAENLESASQPQKPVVSESQPIEPVVSTPQTLEPVVKNEPVPASTPVTRPPLVASEQFQILQSGALNADLMFLGEEMFDVNNQQPFAKSSALLGKMIQAMKFDVNEVSIVSVAKKDMAIDCDSLVKMALDKVISVVKPKVIVVMGALPSKALLGTNDLILNIRGKWLKYGEIQCMPTYHPFYLSRVEARKREAWTDLQQVMAYLGK